MTAARPKISLQQYKINLKSSRTYMKMLNKSKSGEKQHILSDDIPPIIGAHTLQPIECTPGHFIGKKTSMSRRVTTLDGVEDLREKFGNAKNEAHFVRKHRQRYQTLSDTKMDGFCIEAINIAEHKQRASSVASNYLPSSPKLPSASPPSIPTPFSPSPPSPPLSKLPIPSLPCSPSIKKPLRNTPPPLQSPPKSPKSTQPKPVYRNEKLTILQNSFPKLLSTLRQQDQITKFGRDMEKLEDYFQCQPKNIVIDRYMSQNMMTMLGKLVFFVGYELTVRYAEGVDLELKDQELALSGYYQIYFSMRMGIPLLILECYEVLMDLALERGNYTHAQRYAQKCLQASIFYKQKYYQKSIQKISMCQYYRGNIYQATYLHENNGQVTQQSLRKIKDGYNQNIEMQQIFHHLYQTPKFDVRELLLTPEEIVMKNYREMVVFYNPRIGVDDSMKLKKHQLKIDLMKMQRYKQFKAQASIIKKQFKVHQNLFTVRKTSNNDQQFRLKKRNLTVNKDNQSSQVLKAHQSLNRISIINLIPLRNRLITEFYQFCADVVTKLRVTAVRISLF